MQMPFWVQIIVALLLIASSLLTLASAFGLVRLAEFFRRMHVPALAATLGTWCAALASIICFGLRTGNPGLAVWLIPILLSITAPITTALLARAALFRRRAHGDPQIPPPVAGQVQAAQTAPRLVPPEDPERKS
jgi:multicomponent K+:H+ antiporter subunit G